MELLTPRQLAELVGVPVGTIYRWNWTGTGPARCRVGKHVRYRRADVEQWLASRVDEPATRAQ
jgi:excisionase family DNA binding protein